MSWWHFAKRFFFSHHSCFVCLLASGENSHEESSANMTLNYNHFKASCVEAEFRAPNVWSIAMNHFLKGQARRDRRAAYSETTIIYQRQLWRDDNNQRSFADAVLQNNTVLFCQLVWSMSAKWTKDRMNRHLLFPDAFLMLFWHMHVFYSLFKSFNR